MNHLEELLRETAARIFADHCTTEVLQRAEKGEWPQALWSQIEAAGLIDAVDPESDGQRLLPLETLSVIVLAAGEYALPLPVVETLLAQRMFHQAGLAYPSGPLSIAPPASQLPQLRKTADGWELSGTLRRVPWGRHVAAIATEALFEDQRMLVRLEGLQPSTLGRNLANEPRDTFVLQAHPLAANAVAASAVAPRNALALEGALMRSLQIVGAMGFMLGQTLQYSLERVQFGRPIAKFQAVQHQVAVMATHVAAAAAATEAAVFVAGSVDAEFEILAAKARASEAAGMAVNVAHQVHGAMGFTHEHSLHWRSRRLMSWRDEFGSEAECHDWIGRRVQLLAGTDIWAFIGTPRVTADPASAEAAA